MTLFLGRMGALSAAKAHVAPRLPKPILNISPMHRHIFQRSNFPKQYYALNAIFKLLQRFLKNFRKSIMMVKVFRYLTILVVATHRCSIKKLF